MSVNSNSPPSGVTQGVQQKDGPIFVMQSMSAGNHGSNQFHERYMSNESLENDRNSTTSSTESPNSSGTQPRKDHEFIPTRSKTITASRPAANPNQFTKIPSNPLLISAQKQIMQAEEIRKRKESEKMVRKGDDEPDWQNELSTWKTRRRKQSEDAFQRVAEVKALEDSDSGEPRKLSIGKKLSSLLYTNPEDDWSDLGLDGNDYDDSPDHPSSSSSQAPSSALSPTEQKMLLQKNNSNQLSSQYNKSISPSTINEDEEESVNVVNENNTNHNMNNKFDLGPKVQNWTEVIRNDAPKRTISSPMVTYTQKEADNSIGSSNGENAPQVRRKSSELSASMKTRLEAFNSSTQASGIPETEKADAVKTTVEPDKTFHNKLQAFRKISEGNLHQQEVERKPKPPMTISSLLGGGTNASRSDNNSQNPEDRNNEEYENDTLDDVDQLLDDALEESYRSVLETDQSSHSSMSNPSSMVITANDKKKQNGDSSLVFSGDDFVGHKSTKAPPSEKPPPVPPINDAMSSNIDEEIDKQEQAIIASLEMEEREHKRYMEIQEKMRRMPTPSGASETKKLSGQMAQMSNSLSSNDKMMTSSSSSQLSPKKISDSKPNAMNKVNSAGNIMHQGNNNTNNYNAQQQKQADQQQLQAKKRSQQQEQKSYNQHWLIQEAEQRRLAGGSTKPQRVSPSMNQQINNQMNMNQNYQQNNGHHLNNMMMTSPISQGGDMPPSPNHINTQSPVYENSSYVNHQQHNVHQNNMYTNHQRIPPQPTNDNNWQQHNGVQNGMGYNDQSPQQQHNTNLNQQYPIPNENVYANLGSQPPLGPNMHHQDNSSLNYEREGLIPGPQVPPRNPQETSPGSHGDRVLSVSGKKRCSHCKEELGRGAAMIIESLRLFYHLRCFQCCVCQVQLGNGASGTDVRVRNNKLHCQNCYSNDEGLKFSKV